MKVGFDDPQFSFQALRMLGSAGQGMAEVGEVLRTAERIVEGDFESWHREWLVTAERVHAIGDDCSRSGHTVSAGEAWMRASNYYRAAEFYLHGDPQDPRILDLSRRSIACFDRALALLELPVEPLEIPYEGTALPGLFYRAQRDLVASPTLLLQTGYDGTLEELHPKALAANRFDLSGVAGKIRCPTLVIDVEEETSFEGQAKQLYDALTCSRTFMLFTREEGAEDHCQVATPLLAQQRIFDWLTDTLGNA